MPAKDPRIAQLVTDRWQQYNSIRETETSPEGFCTRVGQLLNDWFLEDAPLLVAGSDDEPRDQWFLVQEDLHEVALSANPRAALQEHHARWAQVKRLP